MSVTRDPHVRLVRADRQARAALRRARTLTTAGLAVLAPVCLAVALVGDWDARGLLASAGLGLLLLAGTIICWCQWEGRGRERPRVTRRGVVLHTHRAVGLAALLGAMGMVLLSFWVLQDTAIPVTEVDRMRRQGTELAAVMTALLAVPWALVLLLRPGQVLLAPWGVAVRTLGHTRQLTWDEIATVRPHTRPSSALALELIGVDGTRLPVTTHYLDLTMWELRGVLLHYMTHVSTADELVTRAALSTIHDVRRRVATPMGPEPRWFAAPIRGGQP